MIDMANPQISTKTGNLFHSYLQTFVVTVNCVGVMGKGIALVAKHLYPDAYKYYQDLCERDEVRFGKPVIYDKHSNSLQSNFQARLLHLPYPLQAMHLITIILYNIATHLMKEMN